MARSSRVIVPGAVYHITARGNYKQTVFFNEDDHRDYLDRLARHSAEYGLDLHGWCLMRNHVHLLAMERKPDAMAATIKRVHGEYSARINARQGQTSGHLWQNRFYSAPIQFGRIWAVLRYIELNPVRAGICQSAETYHWSSARHHLCPETAPAFLNQTAWQLAWTPSDWRLTLHAACAPEEDKGIRTATLGGRPWGDSAFVRTCGLLIGRSLEVRRVGRPIRATAVV